MAASQLRRVEPTGDHWVDRLTQHRASSADPRTICSTCHRGVVEGNHARCPRCWAFLVVNVDHVCEEVTA